MACMDDPAGASQRRRRLRAPSAAVCHLPPFAARRHHTVQIRHTCACIAIYSLLTLHVCVMWGGVGGWGTVWRLTRQVALRLLLLLPGGGGGCGCSGGSARRPLDTRGEERRGEERGEERRERREYEMTETRVRVESRCDVR